MTGTATTGAAEEVARLLDEHGSKIYALGLRMCGSPEAAEDLVQETFLNAYRHWDQFEGRAAATTWLYTIARRACFRMRRKRAGEPARLTPVDELVGEDVADLPEAGPWDESLRREAEEAVDEGLENLPLDFRLPLVLVDVAELSIAEAAEVLGLKENTVKTRVHRARLKLRRSLERRLPRRQRAAGPRQVCLSMLQAKQEALDRGVAFPYSNEALCSRCRAVFATLDLGREACLALGRGPLPPALRTAVEEVLRAGGAGG